jgi:hypothetical protein
MDIEDVLEIDITSDRAVNGDDRIDFREQILRSLKIRGGHQVRLV